MSCVVAPLWKAGSSSRGSRCCTAFTKGMTGTPDTPVAAPSAARSSDAGSIAAIVSASSAGASPSDAWARASATSAASIAATRAVSENTARIRAVVTSGERMSLSRAENAMALSV